MAALPADSQREHPRDEHLAELPSGDPEATQQMAGPVGGHSILLDSKVWPPQVSHDPLWVVPSLCSVRAIGSR